MNFKKRKKISVKVLTPWIIFLILLFVLIFIRYNQNSILKDLRIRKSLHRSAVLLSNRMRYEAEERWSLALLYYLNRNENILVSIKKSEEQTNIYFNDLNEFAINKSLNRSQVDLLHSMSLINSHKLTYDSYMALYHHFLESIEKKESEKLFLLLSSQNQILEASLDDLRLFHEISEKTITDKLDRLRLRYDTQLFIFFGILILGGFIFSKYQSMSIIQPIMGLTKAALQIGKGTDVDLSIFHGEDEIGKLSQAFSQLINSLHASNREISIAYADVERQVKIRTKELWDKTQLLEGLNKDLESFSYSVSHDLRAPLRAIDGYISLLQDDYCQNFDDEGLRLFQVVRNSAINMGQLIDDILAISRAGRIDLEYLPVDMTSLVNEVWEGLDSGRKDRDIDFQLEELATVACDPRAIIQVWQNLIGNAIKFTRLNPHARIRVFSKEVENSIEYTIEDNGVGFNPEYSKKLFQLFQRLHNKDEFEGTGVGLALVNKFVQKHKGTIKGHSVLHKGAAFSFTLPRENPSLVKDKE